MGPSCALTKGVRSSSSRQVLLKVEGVRWRTTISSRCALTAGETPAVPVFALSQASRVRAPALFFQTKRFQQLPLELLAYPPIESLPQSSVLRAADPN